MKEDVYKIRKCVSGDGKMNCKLICPAGIFNLALTLVVGTLAYGDENWTHAPGVVRLTTSGDRVGIGESSPNVKLHVRGGTDVSPSRGGFIQLGSSRGKNIAIDQNEIMARNNGQVSILHINHNGGNVVFLSNLGFPLDENPSLGSVGIRTTKPSFTLHVNGTAGKPGGGSWSNASDRRLKTNIRDLNGALDRLMQLRGVTFEFKDPQAINELPGVQMNLIAQEVEAVFPGWVDNSPDGYKRVTFRGFEALTVEAIRDLREERDEQVRKLEVELDTLQTTNARLEARLDSLESLVGKLAKSSDQPSRRPSCATSQPTARIGSELKTSKKVCQCGSK